MEPKIDITLWQFPGIDGLSLSPYANKVHWALRLKGVAYRTESVRFAKGVSRTEYLPVLELDGRLVHDSSEILRALDERFPEPRLVPASRLDAARAHGLEEWIDEGFLPPRGRARRARKRPI